MRRVVHLTVALAALAMLAIGGVVLLKYAARFEQLLPAPAHQLTNVGPPKHQPARPQQPPRHRRAAEEIKRRQESSSAADPFMHRAPLYLGLAAWAGLLLLGVIAAGTVDRRLRNRLIRRYERYEIKLSMHDDTKPGDLEDMVEAIGATVRKRYNDRVSQGQPFVALELWHRASAVGMQWTLCLVCEENMAGTLEGIIAGVYPDVRIGHEFDEEPRPIDGSVEEPRHVMRFRKRRSYIYPLGGPSPTTTHGQAKTTPLVEAIAMTQTSLAVPSLVRFQIMPTSEQLEDRARRRLERQERRKREREHHHRLGMSLLDEAEMRSAVAVRQRSMFYLEVQVGSSDWETCNRISASLVARRGENHLHRRYMIVRQRLYRRRFASACPPLLPTASLRNLVSGAELAHLLELPSARMKGVPVRRLALPRMPAPPDAFRAADPQRPPAPLPDAVLAAVVR